MGMACMENPLSLWHFYLRNKRKVLPVIGILALAILGVVVTDSLLASARETAYATFGSYQKLILVAPRATRDQDLANPLQDSLTRLHEVQLQVEGFHGTGVGSTSRVASLRPTPPPSPCQLKSERSCPRASSSRSTPLTPVITPPDCAATG